MKVMQLLLGLMILATPAFGGDRLTDRDVKEPLPRQRPEKRLDRRQVRTCGDRPRSRRTRQDAKTVRSRVKDGKPSSAEAEALLGRAEKVRAFIESHHVPVSSSAWASFAPSVQMLADAYPPRRP